ncbi:MAG: hypothetical protein ACRDTZ_05395, partial [Pseudonocardiaceae bacterium]
KLRGRAALVREDMLWDPEEGRPVVAREVPSGLAVLEGRERDRLARELREIVKIRLELQAARTRERDDAAARARQLREWQDDASRDLVLAVRAALEEAGRDWSAPETQELARRALDRVPGMRDGGGTMR